MKDVFEWINIVATGHQYYYITMVSLVPLFILMKKRRKSFLLPVTIVSALILTPFFYKFTAGTIGYYWRILWLLPVIPLSAAFPCVISEKIKENQIVGKIALFGIYIIIFIMGGTYIYNYHFGNFEKPTNAASKLPKEAVEVADYLLSIDDNPYVIVTPEMKYDVYLDCWTVSGLQDYLRQYTGDINLIFGRFNYIYSMSSEAETVYSNLMSEDGDLGKVAQIMLDFGYSYLVVKEDDRITNNLEEYGFEILNVVAGYKIYKVHGNPNYLREKNELGQVVSVTRIDQMGNPIMNESGFSKVSYSYDSNGNIIGEFRTDITGKGVLDWYGYAGIEREYDFKSRLISEKMLGEDGKPIKGSKGYIERKKSYGFRKIYERYYDENETLISNAFGYAMLCKYYDKNNLCIKELYFDENEKKITSTFGYAEIRREYDDKNRCVCERYYDEKGEACVFEAGYSGKRMYYDESDLLIKLNYLDSEGNEKVRNDGFSEVQWIFNEQKGTRDIALFDDKGVEVSLEYINLFRGGDFHEDSWSNWMTPEKNVTISCFQIGMANLGPKEEGDVYSCSLLVEFQDVEATPGEQFLFWTQGLADGTWDYGNIWDPSLIYFKEAPQDGVYYFSTNVAIDEKMVQASEFNIGFRCDNWAKGAFRVKEVMIHKGDYEMSWKPGL